MKNILNQDNFLQDSAFRQAIINQLKEISLFREKIIDRTARYNADNFITTEIKLNRTPYVYLLEHGMLNVDSLLIECEKMMQKKSVLPSTVRRYLGQFFSLCMSKAIEVHAEKFSKTLKK
jgi:hypothetical protein